MIIPDELEFFRKNKVLIVRKLNDGFGFYCGKIEKKFSFIDNISLKEEISFIEDNLIRVGDLIDALTKADVLHPIYLDIIISPIGRGGKYKMHIKWEGYGNEILKFLPENILPSQKDLIEGLEILGHRCLEMAERIKEPIEKAYEKAYTILGPLFLEIFFPGLIRGPFLKFPFRKITISDFKGKKSFSIRLTPFEARRLARFLSF